MPRAPRYQQAGLLHHVVCRGNDKQVIFKSPKDYITYLDLLEEARKLFPLKVYNYVLMDNHIHLLVEPTEKGSLSKVMEYVSKAYAKYFNKMHLHSGHVFQGRFKSFLIQEERYFFACTRYIDLNPVKANIVNDPKQYKWSAYGYLIGAKEPKIKLDQHDLYQELGKTIQERQIAYRALVISSQEDVFKPAFPAELTVKLPKIFKSCPAATTKLSGLVVELISTL